MTCFACDGHEEKLSWEVVQKLPLFTRQDGHRLFGKTYNVPSRVSWAALEAFIEGIRGNKIYVSETNHEELACLCEEFQYHGFDDELTRFRKKEDVGCGTDMLNQFKYVKRTVNAMRSRLQDVDDLRKATVYLSRDHKESLCRVRTEMETRFAEVIQDVQAQIGDLKEMLVDQISEERRSREEAIKDVKVVSTEAVRALKQIDARTITERESQERDIANLNKIQTELAGNVSDLKVSVRHDLENSVEDLQQTVQGRVAELKEYVTVHMSEQRNANEQ